MKNLNKALYSAALITLLTTSCNKEGGEERKADNSQEPVQASSTEIKSDSDLSSEAINTQLVEAINAAASGNSENSSASLSLAGEQFAAPPPKRPGAKPPMPEGGEREFSAECAVQEDGSVSVNITKSFSHSFDRSNEKFTFDESVERSFKASRSWSHSSEDLECDEEGKRVVLPFENMAGLKMEEEITDSFSREGVRSDNNGEEEDKKLSISRSGSVKRSFEITDLSEDADGNILESKTITKDASRSISVTKDGETKEMNMAIKTDDDNPHKIIITRDSETKRPIQREIVSGKDIGTLKSGLVIETSFENVVFTSKRKCSAISGVISGKVLDGEEEVSSFTITFSEDGATKVIDGEETEEISLEGCELEL